jgi:uncharacterized damage-inducible protein DinB
LSAAVRQSTLLRLMRVKKGFENWRPSANAMSFAEIAGHLVDADEWLFRKLKNESLESIRGRADKSRVVSRSAYLATLKKLRQIGIRRDRLIRRLSEPRLAKVIYDDRFEDFVTIWWVVVRGNLDHEIHHRGQTAAYLRILGLDD